MKILAIESSCDETAAAVVQDGVQILSNVVVSQVDIFAVYGGVIPEVAARSHLEAILPVVEKALKDAGVTKAEIDAIAVTDRPGLLGSLLIGTLTARMLAILWGKPLYAVHHLKSHIYSNWLGKAGWSGTTSLGVSDCGTCQPVNLTMNCQIDADKSGLNLIMQSETPKLVVPAAKQTIEEAEAAVEAAEQKTGSMATRAKAEQMEAEAAPEFPLIALVVSGGHTQIIYMREHNQFEIIGATRDDAVGECFDKVAKILGLPYPGGPAIAKCALTGDAKRYKLPHPKVEGLDFSFSGLKTAVLRAMQNELGLPITTPSYELKEHLSKQQQADFAASFQETACEILMEKVKKALEGHLEARSLVLAGGVSANAILREKALAEPLNGSYGALRVFVPEPRLSGDNAAMVGAAAYFEIISGAKEADPYALSIAPRAAIR